MPKKKLTPWQVAGHILHTTILSILAILMAAILVLANTLLPSLAKAAVAVGADGLMIEVHNDPARAKSDGAQSLTPDQFDDLMATIRPELEFFGKTLN